MRPEPKGEARIEILELAEVSGADGPGGGLHLDYYDAVAELDCYIEGRGVSPGPQDFEAVAQGCGHEEEFNPLAASL